MKTGKEFVHFGLESGMVYEGTAVVYQCVRRFNSKRIRKKWKWILRNLFVAVLILAIMTLFLFYVKT